MARRKKKSAKLVFSINSSAALGGKAVEVDAQEHTTSPEHLADLLVPKIKTRKKKQPN